MDAVLFWFKQFDMLIVLARTENDPQRRLFLGFACVPFEPRQIEIHLPLVGGLEIPDFEFNRHT